MGYTIIHFEAPPQVLCDVVSSIAKRVFWISFVLSGGLL